MAAEPSGCPEHVTQFALPYLREQGLGREDLRTEAIAGDGSVRSFWRIACPAAGRSYVAMQNPPRNETLRRENLAYLRIGTHLRQKELPLPAIHRFDPAAGLFLLEDLGTQSLQDRVLAQGNSLPLYRQVVAVLVRLQTEGARGFETAWCYQTARYDPTVMRHHEAHYFRDAFLVRHLGLKQDWPELEAPFDRLIERAAGAGNRFFLHRDFQSRNILIRAGGIGIVDWQGGRLGPLAYDLASLLIDPYTGLSKEERAQILSHYLERLEACGPVDRGAFESTYPYIAVLRNLQILGAFAFLTRVRGKGYFEAYIPPALKSLRGLLRDCRDRRLAPLEALLDTLPVES